MIVVLFHIEVNGNVYAGHLHGVGLIDNGFLFVDFFFVLSGFVISYSYFGRLRTATDFVGFMIRRLGRVYPMHALVLAAFIVLELGKAYSWSRGFAMLNPPFEKYFSIKAILTNLLLIQALDIHEYSTWNGPSWSISVEFITYIVFAALTIFTCGRRWLVSIVCIYLIVATAVVILIYSPLYIDTVFDYAIFRCIYGFCFGVLAQFVHRAVVAKVTIGAVGSAIGIAGSTLLEFAVVGGVVVFVAMTGAVPRSLLGPPLFFLAVLIFSFEGGLVSRLLRRAPFQFLGRLSYTIYITHALVILFFARVLKMLQGSNLVPTLSMVRASDQGVQMTLTVIGSDIASDVAVTMVMAAVILLSCILFRYFENPCRIACNRIAGHVEGRMSRGLWPRKQVAQP